MSCLTFLLLAFVLGWVAVIQLINSPSKAGELSRLFLKGLIERIVGRPSDGLRERQDRDEPDQ